MSTDPESPFDAFAASGSRAQRPLIARGPVDPTAPRFPPRPANRIRGDATDVDGYDLVEPELVPGTDLSDDPDVADFVEVEVVEDSEVEVVAEEATDVPGSHDDDDGGGHGEPGGDPLAELAAWAATRADGLWPLTHRIEITSTDLGGWRIRVPLTGTPADGRRCRGAMLTRSRTDWIRYGVHQQTFVGTGGPDNLAELIRAFTDFAR